jgi:hypothetical protein
MALAEYDGGGRRAFIILPKGQDSVGWKSYILELRKVLYFFQMSYGARVKVSPPRKPLGRLSLSGVDDRSSILEEKAPAEGSEKRSYVEALVGTGKSPETDVEHKGNVGFSIFLVRRAGVVRGGGAPSAASRQTSFFLLAMSKVKIP